MLRLICALLPITTRLSNSFEKLHVLASPVCLIFKAQTSGEEIF